MKEQQNKIVFLILHYYTIEDTKKCVESIKNNVKDNYEIVIVDNASPNGTGEELIQFYKEEEKIHILINNKNLGFAKGNNVGFEYAKRQLKADFIVMINNDTIILQNNFSEIILKEYEKSKFAVMGPKILLPNERIYYYPEKLVTEKQLKKNIFKSYVYLILEYTYLAQIIRMVKKVFKKTNKSDSQNYKKEEIVKKTGYRKENIVLHGCFLIFSPEYVSRFDGLDDRTFLYKEEQLLYLRILRNKLKTVYNPELIILHNESSATRTTNSKKRKRNILTCKNQIKSSKIVLSEIRKERHERK